MGKSETPVKRKRITKKGTKEPEKKSAKKCKETKKKNIKKEVLFNEGLLGIATNTLKNTDICDIVHIESNTGLLFAGKGFVNLRVKFPFMVWINFLNGILANLFMDDIFMNKFHVNEIDLNEDAKEKDIYKRLREILDFHICIFEEIILEDIERVIEVEK